MQKKKSISHGKFHEQTRPDRLHIKEKSSISFITRLGKEN